MCIKKRNCACLQFNDQPCLFASPEEPEDISSDTSSEDGDFNPLMHFREGGREFTWLQLCEPVAVWLTLQSAQAGDPQEYAAPNVTEAQVEDFYFNVWHPDYVAQ